MARAAGSRRGDLRALAVALPPLGVTVALVEQPWRVAGKKVAPAPATLDTGWRAVWPALERPGLGLVAGGRSAGARVACRTARELGARAVLALSFPLHPPGRPEKSRAAELLGSGVPTLVVQGGNDPFGKPAEFPEGAVEWAPGETGETPEGATRSPEPSGGGYGLLEVPYGDHSFAVPKKAPLGPDGTLEVITGGVARWLAAPGGSRRE